MSVLSEQYIQRWSFAAPGSETFLYQDQDLLRKIKDKFHTTLWASHDVSGAELWLLDMQQYQQGEVVVLAASLNLAHTPQLHYALITLSDAGDHFVVKQMHLLAYNAFYSKAEEANLLSVRFILGRSYAYVFSGQAIYPVLINGEWESSLSSGDFKLIQLNPHRDSLGGSGAPGVLLPW